MLDLCIAGRSFTKPEFLTEFVRIYRGLPALWDRNHPDSSSYKKRRESWDKLLRYTQTKIPEATLHFMKRKLASARTSVLKEWRRVNESLKNGVPGDVYKPSLWYYDLLLFSISSPDQEDDVTIQSELREENSEDNSELHVEESEETNIYWTSAKEGSNELGESISDHVLESQSLKRKLPDKEATQYFDQSPLEIAIDMQDEDEYDALSKTYVAKLGNVTSSQRDLAERLIQEVLSRGVLNQLTTSTCVSKE